jgi:hypothetical protein
VLAVKAKNREKCFCDKQKIKIIARIKSKKSAKVLLSEAKFDCFIGAEKNTVCFHTGTHSSRNHWDRKCSFKKSSQVKVLFYIIGSLKAISPTFINIISEKNKAG